MTADLIMPQLQRAQSLFQMRQPGSAWAILAPLRAALDHHAEALKLYALVAQGVGQIDASIEALRRIAVIERDPPEILGAIADTLGKADRHAEAFAQWQVLANRHPEIIEAHLNSAVAAANAELHDEAIAAIDRALPRFPNDARLLAIRAMALKNAERIPEALEAFERAIAVDPNRALTRHNQAVTLRAACRFDEACAAYAAAEQLGMKGAQFYANWAAAALEAEQVADAETLYAKALDVEPLHAESRKGLTRLKVEYRGGEGAFDHYARQAERRPLDQRIWYDWASALIVNRRTAEAQEIAERGLKSNPGSVPLRAAKYFAMGMIGDASLAMEELEAVLRTQPGDPNVEALIPQVALRAGRPVRAADILQRRVTASPGDQTAWSLLSLAWRLLDDPREQWLCDYDRLVMVTDVPSIEGLAATDYATTVASMLDPLHVALAEPGDQSLRGGTQTSGALFSRPEADIQAFRAAVLAAVDDRIATLPDDPEHPFLRRKLKRADVVGSWSVRLAPGGHHASHVHPQGWISSAYYARLPADAATETAGSHEGWIQFGVPPEHLGLNLGPRRLVEPKEGRLVLFPSYMWHGTVPFHDGDRLTAAFDFRPV